MSFGVNLIDVDGLDVFSLGLGVYQVKAVHTLGNGLSNIPYQDGDILFVGYAGNIATCGVSFFRSSGTVDYIHVATTAPIKVLVMTKASVVGGGNTGYGLSVYNADGSLCYTTTNGILNVTGVHTQTTYGNLGATEFPQVNNTFSINHESGSIFISATIPHWVASRAYDDYQSNSTGLSFKINHSTIGFSHSSGVGWADEGEAGLPFIFATGKFYAA